MEKIKNAFHHGKKDTTTTPTSSSTNYMNQPSTINPSTTTTSTTPSTTTASTTTPTSGTGTGGTGLAPTTYSPSYVGQQGGLSSTGQGMAHTQTGLQQPQMQQQQQSFQPQMQQGQYQQQGVRETDTVSYVEKAPVVHQKIVEMEKEVIQPIISREREQLEIHQITQPMTQREVRPTVVEERVLQPEYRPEVRERGMPIPQVALQSSTTVAPTLREVVQQQPVIEETIHRTIREEIQPILYRETFTPRVIQEVKPIYERVVEAPRVVREDRPPIVLREGESFQSLLGQQPRGMMGGQGMVQGGGIPSNLGWQQQQQQPYMEMKQPLGSGYTGTTSGTPYSNTATGPSFPSTSATTGTSFPGTSTTSGTPLTNNTGLGTNLPSSNLGGSYPNANRTNL